MTSNYVKFAFIREGKNKKNLSYEVPNTNYYGLGENWVTNLS